MFRFIIVVIAMFGCALGLVLAVEILSVNCNFDYCTSEAGPLVGFIVPGLLRNRWLPQPYEIEFIAKAFVPIVLLSVATILRAFRSQYELPSMGNNLRLIKRIYDTIILTLIIAAIADMVVLWTGGVRRGSNVGYAAYEIELLAVLVLLINVSALGIAFVIEHKRAGWPWSAASLVLLPAVPSGALVGLAVVCFGSGVWLLRTPPRPEPEETLPPLPGQL